ncbi:hypothetical protein BJ508DRAFT_419022 [Ascobolus immersus RN42]|uniref:Uncharacterized protein n=1 Tax=Ascobolus immersus RN42 TaxID=1160509 RepID=A0A3N4HV27_ASCIM|nr:hypothetical protein BJ508DRAFT_419022 [Ascobolus immersus RN42]
METDSDAPHYASRSDSDHEREDMEINKLADQICKAAQPWMDVFLNHEFERRATPDLEMPATGSRHVDQVTYDRVMELMGEGWSLAESKLKRRLKHLQRDPPNNRRHNPNPTVSALTEESRRTPIQSSRHAPTSPTASNLRSANRGLTKPRNKRKNADSDAEGCKDLDTTETCECPFRLHSSLMGDHTCVKAVFSGDTPLRDCRSHVRSALRAHFCAHCHQRYGGSTDKNKHEKICKNVPESSRAQLRMTAEEQRDFERVMKWGVTKEEMDEVLQNVCRRAGANECSCRSSGDEESHSAKRIRGTSVPGDKCTSFSAHNSLRGQPGSSSDSESDGMGSCSSDSATSGTLATSVSGASDPDGSRHHQRTTSHNNSMPAIRTEMSPNRGIDRHHQAVHNQHITYHTAHMGFELEFQNSNSNNTSATVAAAPPLIGPIVDTSFVIEPDGNSLWDAISQDADVDLFGQDFEASYNTSSGGDYRIQDMSGMFSMPDPTLDVRWLRNTATSPQIQIPSGFFDIQGTSPRADIFQFSGPTETRMVLADHTRATQDAVISLNEQKFRRRLCCGIASDFHVCSTKRTLLCSSRRPIQEDFTILLPKGRWFKDLVSENDRQRSLHFILHVDHPRSHPVGCFDLHASAASPVEIGTCDKDFPSRHTSSHICQNHCCNSKEGIMRSRLRLNTPRVISIGSSATEKSSTEISVSRFSDTRIGSNNSTDESGNIHDDSDILELKRLLQILGKNEQHEQPESELKLLSSKPRTARSSPDIVEASFRSWFIRHVQGNLQKPELLNRKKTHRQLTFVEFDFKSDWHWIVLWIFMIISLFLFLRAILLTMKGLSFLYPYCWHGYTFQLVVFFSCFMVIFVRENISTLRRAWGP